MNHIKRGQYLSLKPQKNFILDVYTGHRTLIHTKSREISNFFPEKMAPKRVYTCLAISRD